MKVAVKFTSREELKALPILLRHSTGMMLPGDIYVISEEAASAFREAGVRYVEVSRESSTPGLEGLGSGERT